MTYYHLQALLLEIVGKSEEVVNFDSTGHKNQVLICLHHHLHNSNVLLGHPKPIKEQSSRVRFRFHKHKDHRVTWRVQFGVKQGRQLLTREVVSRRTSDEQGSL